MRRGLSAVVLVSACVGTACSGHPKRPAGPPPEYERPVLAPWDSGATSAEPDLEHVKREEVTDDEEPSVSSDAGAEASTPRDAAVLQP